VDKCISEKRLFKAVAKKVCQRMRGSEAALQQGRYFKKSTEKMKNVAFELYCRRNGNLKQAVKGTA
jgi:hypothetical protein